MSLYKLVHNYILIYFNKGSNVESSQMERYFQRGILRWTHLEVVPKTVESHHLKY